MALGSGIFLLVVGAVLAFAVRDNVESVDMAMIGYIAMIAGGLAIILSLILNAQGSKMTHKEVIEKHDDTAATTAGD